MSRLVLKLIAVPSILLLSDFLIGSLFFPTYVQPILIGIALAVSLHFLEVGMLRRGTLWLTTASDIVLTLIFLLLGAYLFPGTRVPLDGVLLTATFVGFFEYLYHRRLLSTESAPKM